MMRANLLPRPRETFAIFGFEIDCDYLRTAVFGLAVVLAVGAIGLGIEQVRLHRLESLALRSEAQCAARATRRNQSKLLALEVARYQEFEREAQTFRRSGSDAALAIARIGNSVPDHVWLESLNREPHDFHVTGRSQSVETLSGAILALGKALPGTSASLIDIDNRAAAGDGTHFSAKLATPDATPGATAFEPAIASATPVAAK